MTEPSPNAAAAQNPDIDPAITNGLAQQASTEQPADVEMTDSGAVAAVTTRSRHPIPSSNRPPTNRPNSPANTFNHYARTPICSFLPTAPTPTPAASSRNSPHPTAQAPTQPIPHGSPTRVYLNQHVTPHLLEAMKHLATTEPEKPLKWLSEFLAQKSREIEGP
ncbi:unnamed protein product [Alternaria alternata]